MQILVRNNKTPDGKYLMYVVDDNMRPLIAKFSKDENACFVGVKKAIKQFGKMNVALFDCDSFDFTTKRIKKRSLLDWISGKKINSEQVVEDKFFRNCY